MKPRTNYSIDGSGRLFRIKKLEEYRSELCRELRKVGKGRIADAYEKMTLEKFAANGGYVIVK